LLLENLAAAAAGSESPGVMKAQVKGATAPKVAWLFTGQGSQYVGMGRQLYDTQPKFRNT
jgi:acyl transferase domain-containing protein